MSTNIRSMNSSPRSLNYYSPRIMTSLGLSSTQASLFATGVYGLVRWVAILIAMLWASDKFGRRTMFIFGGVGMGAMMWIVGGIVQATNPTTTGAIPLTASAYVAIVCIYLYAVFFCFSFAGGVYLCRGCYSWCPLLIAPYTERRSPVDLLQRNLSASYPWFLRRYHDRHTLDVQLCHRANDPVHPQLHGCWHILLWAELECSNARTSSTEDTDDTMRLRIHSVRGLPDPFCTIQ
jgi:hypothetical protein